MSLYNALFGENPAADIFLGLLGLQRGDFYRYRDCYLVMREGKELIAVHTRGGGGNRVDNDTDVAGHPSYVFDEDEDFDNTYATYYFSISESSAEVIKLLNGIDGRLRRDPKESWEKLLNSLHSGNRDDPMVENAIQVGKKIFAAYVTQFSDQTDLKIEE